MLIILSEKKVYCKLEDTCYEWKLQPFNQNNKFILFVSEKILSPMEFWLVFNAALACLNRKNALRLVAILVLGVALVWRISEILSIDIDDLRVSYQPVLRK